MENNNQQQERAFKGVWIPKEVWLNPDLRRNRFARDLLVEIHSLDNDFGCVANNRYFAEFFFCTTQNISNAIQWLEEKKYITITYKDIKTYNGRVIKVDKALFHGISSTPPKPEVEPPKPEVEPPKPEVEHNNTFNIVSISVSGETQNLVEVLPLVAHLEPQPNSDPATAPTNSTNQTFSSYKQNLTNRRSEEMELEFAIDSVLNHPLFEKNQAERFPLISETRLRLLLETYLSDYPKSKITNVFSYLEGMNKKENQAVSKMEIANPNRRQYEGSPEEYPFEDLPIDPSLVPFIN